MEAALPSRRRLDCTKGFPELHARTRHIESSAQHIEHRRRLVGCWVHATLALFAPHKAQVGEESLHGRFESACRLGAFPTRRFESARRLDAPLRGGSVGSYKLNAPPLGDLRKARERVQRGFHEVGIAITRGVDVGIREVAATVPRREDRAANALGIGLEEHDFALVRRAEPRKFVSSGDGCSQSGRAAAYDGNLFHDVRV